MMPPLQVNVGDKIPITVMGTVCHKYWHKDEEYCIVTFDRHQEPWRNMTQIPVFIVRLSGQKHDEEAILKGLALVQRDLLDQ
jgi:hypothetical protein